MSWAPALQGAGIAFIGLVLALTIDWRHRRHNKRINLPPPASACRRNGPEATP